LSGIAQTIAGPGSVKEGYFHKKVIGRHQDLSMRGTIVPEPSLSLDEVAIPRKAATEIYKPFVVRRLRRLGYSPLDAQEQILKGTALAREALQTEIKERPLLLKRDPVLHKYGVQAFKPVLVEGKAIKIHPLVTTGYNADFDGDKMSAYVPVSAKAVEEAYKMLPSNNLFSPATGKIMYMPKHEAMLGLFKMTEMGKDNHQHFKTPADAARAVRDGKLMLNDVMHISDTSGDIFGEMIKKSAAPIRTTMGRLLLFQSMPEAMKDKKILIDPQFVVTKKVMEDILNDVGHRQPSDFGRVADRFKDMGNTRATGSSMSLKDLLSYNKQRDPMFATARKEEARIRASALSPEKKKEKVLDVYMALSQDLDKKIPAEILASGNRLYDWTRSGARGSWDQFKQMVVAPVLLADNKGRPVPVPIDRSYSEGLDVASYWTAMHGARMGTIGKVQGTQEPGKFTKQVINVAMNQVVSSED
jgi:DNA-directed RNA polymerase subunit beta'